MAFEWPQCALPDLVDFQEGPGILAKDFHATGIPLIRLKGVDGTTVTLDGCNFLDPEKVATKWKHFQLEIGDLIISTSASLGRVSEVGRAARGAIAYTGLIRFRPKSLRIDRSFLRCLLGAKEFLDQAEASASGSVIRHFGPSHLRRMILTVPPLAVQRQIGTLSDALNARIDHNRALAANLEAIARRLFKSWFVDFDPVRAKAAGEKPSGLADDIAILFPDRFVGSELGEIPEGWAFNPLSSIAEFVNGRNFTKDATGTGRMIIRIAELSNGGPTGSTVWNDLPRTAEQYLANPGNILFAWSGSLGIHVWDRNTGLVNQHIFKVIPKPPFAAPFVFFATEDLVDDFRAIAAGKAVTMGHIKRNDLDTHGVTCPSAPELITAFHKIVAPLWDRVRVARREALTLGSIRDLLLPRLISGKLRVEDAVSLVEETIA